jgi:hypothetical protein
LNTRFLSLALSAAVLIILALALPSGAGAFGVANVKFEQSTLQASGHPTATLSFDRTGTEAEDVKDMDIELPAGVFANPEAANPKCTQTQFTSDKCPGNSQVGDVEITVKAMGLLDMTIKGSVYVLNPEPTETATMGLTLRPDSICILIICAVPDKIFLKTGANLRTYGDQGLTATAPTSPNKSTIKIPLIIFTPAFDTEITINKVKFRFYDRTGQYVTKRVCGGFLNLFCKDVTTPPSGPYFFRQSAECSPKTIKVNLLSYQNVRASNTASYTPDGCNAVPFTPSVVINPHSKDAGVPTQLDFIMSEPETDAPIQQSLPKFVDVSLPKGSGLNLAGLAGVEGCTEYQLTHPDPTTGKSCPDASIIGRADTFSKYLPGPIVGGQPTAGLAGNVYAMGVGNMVPIAVELKGRGNTVVLFRGVMGTRGEGADARLLDVRPDPRAAVRVDQGDDPEVGLQEPAQLWSSRDRRVAYGIQWEDRYEQLRLRRRQLCRPAEHGDRQRPAGAAGRQLNRKTEVHLPRDARWCTFWRRDLRVQCRRRRCPAVQLSVPDRTTGHRRPHLRCDCGQRRGQGPDTGDGQLPRQPQRIRDHTEDHYWQRPGPPDGRRALASGRDGELRHRRW